MASVTIPGAGPSPITETFGNTANLQLALRSEMRWYQPATLVSSTSPDAGPRACSWASLLDAGGINELVIIAGGDTPYRQDQRVHPTTSWSSTRLLAGDVTITARRTQPSWAGSHMSRSSIRDYRSGRGSGNATATINGIGDVLAGNNLNDTLTAAGFKGSIAGGTGTNLFRDLGATTPFPRRATATRSSAVRTARRSSSWVPAYWTTAPLDILPGATDALWLVVTAL